jgi:Family of unknown function (DUF6159)
MTRDPTMVWLALLGAGCGLAGALLMLYLGGVFTPGRYSRAHFWLISLAFVYPLTFLGSFFNVALTAAAAASFEGRWLGVRGALEEAVERLRPIAVWSLLVVGVSVVIGEIASRVPYVNALVARLLGAAWNLGAIFAIPLLTLEDADPIEAVRGSVHLVKSRWGEGLTGTISISAWTVLAMIPIWIIGIGGAVVVKDDRLAGAALLFLAAASFTAVVAVATGTRQVFNLVLFRYATGVATPGFGVGDLEQPFANKRERRRRRTRKWAWIALGLVVGLLALGLLLSPKQHRGPVGPGFWYVSYNSAAQSSIRDGMPVKYRGHRVGTVFEHWSEGNRVRVGYYVDPSLHVPVRTTEPALIGTGRGYYLGLVQTGAQPRSAGSTERS